MESWYLAVMAKRTRVVERLSVPLVLEGTIVSKFKDEVKVFERAGGGTKGWNRDSEPAPRGAGSAPCLRTYPCRTQCAM